MARHVGAVNRSRLAVTAAPARPAGSWVGQTVIVKRGGVRYGRTDPQTGQPVCFGKLKHLSYRVEADEGAWVRVRQDGVSGWVAKAEVALPSEAVDYFTAQIRRRPTSDAYHRRAVAWRKRGELDSAVADFTEAIRRDPKAGAVFNGRGVAWDDKQEYDKAIIDYTEAIRLDPTDARAFYNRGNAWWYKQEYDRAVADYTEAVRLDPTFALAFNHRRVAWCDQKAYDQAVADFTEAIRLDPTGAVAYYNRGVAWEAKREYGKAIADYTEAIRLDPKDPSAFNGRAWLWATCPDGRYRDGKRAVKSARKAWARRGWSEPIIFGTLAAAYAEAGQFDKAVKYQTKALESPEYEKAYGETARQRLTLYEQRQPYRDVERK